MKEILFYTHLTIDTGLFPGYLSTFFLGLDSGMVVFDKYLSSHAISRWLGLQTASNRRQVIIHLSLRAAFYWILFFAWITFASNEESLSVSRRMASFTAIRLGWKKMLTWFFFGWLGKSTLYFMGRRVQFILANCTGARWRSFWPRRSWPWTFSAWSSQYQWTAHISMGKGIPRDWSGRLFVYRKLIRLLLGKHPYWSC